MRVAILLSVVALLFAAATTGPLWQVQTANPRPIGIGACPFMGSGNLPIYPVCDDQALLFEEALAAARRDGQLVVVEFGATWCSQCRLMHEAWRQPEWLDAAEPEFRFADRFRRVVVGTSAIDDGRMTDVASGRAVLAKILASAPGAEMRGWPFVAVIDPSNEERVFTRNTADLFAVKGVDKRTDAERVRQVLIDAERYLRDGVARSPEPKRGVLSRAYHWLIDRAG